MAALLLVACGGGSGGSGDAEDGGAARPASGEPERGGDLVVAVAADTANPWTPAGMVCTTTCFHTIRGTVYESLVVAGSDGTDYPYLVESIEPNDDFTVWTLTAREGIRFHDGTPLDGPAIAYNLQQNVASPELGLAVRPVVDIRDDGDMAVTVSLDRSWSAFPRYLTSQLGFVASPTWLRAVEAGRADPARPVGTGPFQFESYESGENGRLRTTRFEEYWRGSGRGSTGEGLPYLDAVEVRFMPDTEARSRALTAGDVDLVVVDDGVEISRLRDESGIELLAMDAPGSVATYHLLFNNAEELGGEPNPLADERVRRALAMATDREQLAAARTAGVFEAANGPFAPGRPGHVDETGLPDFDPGGARDLLDEVRADTGVDRITVSLKTTTGPQELTTAELLTSMWEEAGFSVSIDQIPEGEFFTEAILGNYQVFTFSSHAGFDPDQEYIWWSSSTLGEGISLNFGRIDDPEVDELLETIRGESDETVRTEAAEDLNRYLMEHALLVPLWWHHPYQAFGEDVHNVGFMRPPGVDEPVRIESPVTPIEIFTTG